MTRIWNSLLLGSIVVATTFCICPQAHAGLVLGFSVNGAAPTIGTSAVSADINDILNIDVYMIEVDTPVADTRLTDRGLLGYNVGTTYNTGLGTVNSVTVAAPWQLPVIDNNTPGSFQASGGAPFVGPPFRGVLDSTDAGTVNRGVLMFSFQYQGTSSGRTDFTFNDFDPDGASTDFSLGNSTTENNFVRIDDELFPVNTNSGANPVFSVNVAVIPEPSSVLVFAGLIGAGFAVNRRRKRQSPKSKND